MFECCQDICVLKWSICCKRCGLNLQCVAKLSFAFGGFYRAVSPPPQLLYGQLPTYLQHHLQPDQHIVFVFLGFVIVFLGYEFVFLGFYRAVSASPQREVGNVSATPSPTWPTDLSQGALPPSSILVKLLHGKLFRRSHLRALAGQEKQGHAHVGPKRSGHHSQRFDYNTSKHKYVSIQN